MSDRLTKMCEYKSLPETDKEEVAIWSNPVVTPYLKNPHHFIEAVAEHTYFQNNKDRRTVVLVEAKVGNYMAALRKYDKVNDMFDAIRDKTLIEDVIEKKLALKLQPDSVDAYLTKLGQIHADPNFHFIPVFKEENGIYRVTDYNLGELRAHTDGKRVIAAGYHADDIVPVLLPEGENVTYKSEFIQR